VGGCGKNKQAPEIMKRRVESRAMTRMEGLIETMEAMEKPRMRL